MSLRDHLQRIYDQRGYLTPELVVEEARPKSSPLHSVVFDKNVKDAAEAYYRDRAHELIQSVKVVYREPTEDETARTVRKWHAVKADDDRYVYRAAEDVAADPVATAVVLQAMEREWKALHRRYGAFAEFAELIRNDLGDQAA
jgi:hypothetical protein